MADALETNQQRLANLPATPEPGREGEPDDRLIARSIASAGLQVCQAVDELQTAAQVLLSAERAAQEAQARWATSDEQLARAAEKNVELLEALEGSRSAQAEAEANARSAQAEAEANARSAQAEASARSAQAEAEANAHRAEAELRSAVDRLRELEDQLAVIEDKWREAEAQPKVTLIVDDERDELQQTLGAEIRRPLTSILGLTLALKHADPKANDSKSMIKQLTTNARRLDRLVGQMLDLDKISAGEYVLNRRRTDVEALVRRVVDEAPDLANHDLRLETEHVAISLDPALTEQMVETLLMNAGRRSAPGSPVWVKVSSDQGGVVIAVDDSGPETPMGLRSEKLSASPMDDRGPAARHGKPRGATGLALLSRLAELHGGRAWVEERPGGGASYRVFLADVVQEHEADTDARAVDLVSGTEEDDVVFDAAIASAQLRELSSFDDLTGELAG